MYVYCVDPAMPKRPKQLTSKKISNKRFYGVRAYTVTVSYSRSRNQVREKLSRSVTVYLSVLCVAS